MTWKPVASVWALTHAEEPIVANEVPANASPVAYGAQQLNVGIVSGTAHGHQFLTGLLQTFSVDDYLASYGKKPKWPTGEYLGKIMQGLSCMHLHTGNTEARQRLDNGDRNVVSPANGRRLAGTTSRFKSWDIWEHKYVCWVCWTTTR